MENRFSEITILIKKSRNNMIKAVNTDLIDLYWNIGEYISKRVENTEWGQSVVKELAK